MKNVKIKLLIGVVCHVIDEKGKEVHKKVLPGETVTVTEKERDKLKNLMITFEEVKDVPAAAEKK